MSSAGKRLLIIGIDPGTKVGYAILDLNGNLIQTYSSKELDLNKLVAITLEIGKALIIGSDKSKIPRLIESFSAKFNAKIMNPKEDLRVSEKIELTNDYKFSNDHERDALSAALFAFKKVKGLFDRIDKYLDLNNHQEYNEKVKELVIKKEIAISTALEILTSKTEKTSIIKRVIEENILSEKDFTKLYNDTVLLKQENQIQKQQILKLNSLIKILNKKQRFLERKLNRKSIIKPDFKEQTIKNLENELARYKSILDKLKTQINEFNKLILNLNNFVVIKKLKNLGWNEYLNKSKFTNFVEGDILLVDDPNEFSERTINKLKDKIRFIIYKKNPTNSLRSVFLFISNEKINLMEYDCFALIDKKQLNNLVKNKDLLIQVVNEYKTARLQNQSFDLI